MSIVNKDEDKRGGMVTDDIKESSSMYEDQDDDHD